METVSPSLSNKAYVLINGQKCKILGRVTMDQTIVDVTKVAQVKPGQIATLIGTDGNASISLNSVR